MSKRYLYLVMLFLAVPMVAVYAQTVTAGTGGNFTTLAAAINSFRSGGSNVADPATNIINCLNATYDEQLPQIDVQLTINGASPRSTIILQQASQGDGNDGLAINLPAAMQLDLNNLILLPSATSSPADDFIDIAGLDGSIVNFNNCIISSNHSGAPANTDGFTAPVGTATGRCGDNGINISKGDTVTNGLTVNISETIIVDAGGPPGAGTVDNIMCTGAGTKTINVIDGSIISYAPRLNYQHNGGTLNITGTHDNPIYIIKGQDEAYGHGLGVWTTNISSVNLTYCIIADNKMNGVSIEAGDKTVSMNHVIIANNGDVGLAVIVVAGQPWNTVITAENTTISGNAIDVVSPDTKDQVTMSEDLVNTSIFTGCIFASGDNGFNIAANSTATAAYSALVLEGANALGAKKIGDGTLVESGVITSDPQFTETSNFLSSTYFDVYNSAYGAAYNGSPLKGGADFAGVIPLSVGQEWTLYW